MILSHCIYGNIKCTNEGSLDNKPLYSFKGDNSDVCVVTPGNELFVITATGYTFTDKIVKVNFEDEDVSFEQGQTIPFWSLMVMGIIGG